MPDSDSDDDFSDIQALRQKLGLGGGPAPPPVSSHLAARTTAVQFNAKQAGAKRPAQSPARARKRQSFGAREHETGSAAAQTSSVSPAEIAALLSPRRQKHRTVGRTKSSDTLSEHHHGVSVASALHIPPRTPESRVASPATLVPPLFTPTRSLSLAGLSDTNSPATQSLDSRRMNRGKESPLPSSRFAVDENASRSTSPNSAVFASRGLWGSATVHSPLPTPARRQQLILSPVGSSRRPLVSVASGLPISNGGSPIGCENGLLGSVEEALITDADMDVAKRKLGEEQAITRQQIIRDIRERMMKFLLLPSATAAEHSEWNSWFDSVSILCQFYTLGHGKLAYGEEGICWRGEALGPITTIAQATNATTFDSDPDTNAYSPAATMTALLFPWTRISGLRQKTIDDEAYVMLTADDDLGVAFKISGLVSSAGAIDTLVSDMAAVQSQSLRVSVAELAPATSNLQLVTENGNDAGCLPVSKGALDDHAIICDLLLKASKRELRFVGQELAGALADQAFASVAADMLRTFGSQLASEALAALGRLNGKKVVEDAGTETLPDACTLCYTDCKSVMLLPCEHKLCGGCFSHLQGLHISQSQENKDQPKSLCVCPWDRSYVTDWSKIAK
ncbi:hypothetical protein GGI20_003397 [Coemansia sp. BCRC 34301]|nr:hypothetical protein GGI20_003397 [Coemansia sp. BCRC 34301]